MRRVLSEGSSKTVVGSVDTRSSTRRSLKTRRFAFCERWSRQTLAHRERPHDSLGLRPARCDDSAHFAGTATRRVVAWRRESAHGRDYRSPVNFLHRRTQSAPSIAIGEVPTSHHITPKWCPHFLVPTGRSSGESVEVRSSTGTSRWGVAHGRTRFQLLIFRARRPGICRTRGTAEFLFDPQRRNR